MEAKVFLKQLDAFKKNELLEIRETIDDLNLNIRITPKTSPFIHLSCQIDLKEKIAVPNIIIRTSSWYYNGERSDLHDVYSILIATVLRVTSSKLYSFSVWDEPNDFSMIPSELYARNIFISQPHDVILPFDENLILIMESIIDGLLLFTYLGHICMKSECIQKLSNQDLYNWKKSEHWAKKIANLLGDNIDSLNVTYNSRKNPHWNFYRSIDSGISVIQNKEMCSNFYQALIGPTTKTIETLNSVNGSIYHSNQIIYNFINNELLEEIKNTLNNFNKKIGKNYFIIPLENKVVVLSKYYLVFFTRDISKKSFEIEREILSERHKQEAKIIFPEFDYYWCDKIDDNEFEFFIKDLLVRERNVEWVRKSGHSRERDGGRDLIGEFYTPPLSKEESDMKLSILIKRRIVVQCKAVSNPLGKSDVIDIRDTIDNFNSDGFFLITSSYLKGSLTSYLDNLREKGEYYIDWWTKSEIEERVKNYPDLLKKYSGIFSPK